MGGFYRHEGETGSFCKVGRDEEGSSSNRAEHAAACIALGDAIAYAGSRRPLILLTDSKCLLMAIQGLVWLKPHKPDMCENDHEKLMAALFGQRHSTSSPCTQTTPTPQSGLTVTQHMYPHSCKR